MSKTMSKFDRFALENFQEAENTARDLYAYTLFSEAECTANKLQLYLANVNYFCILNYSGFARK